MDISGRQWLLAIAGALALHLLLLAGIWLTRDQSPAPKSAPHEVTVSLDDLNAGPPPSAPTQGPPIENVQPENAASQIPAAQAPAPEVAEASLPTAPEAAPAVGPEVSKQPPSASSGAPETTDGAASSAPLTPAIANAVTIYPTSTLQDARPQQEVIARKAQLNPAGGSYSANSSEQAIDNYIAQLRNQLSQHKTYPQVAREQQIEGTVRLYIVVDRNGHVITHHIEQSSGSKLLDQAAEQMLARSEPLPGMPAATRRNRLELVIPVVFTLH